ncbi:MAG: leucyl aminopeptidase [Burkholderiaceae bacterium]|jgi:leucyl aminopeptidase
MEFSTKAGAPEKLKTSCVVVGVYSDSKLTPTGSLIDAACAGGLAKAIKRGDQRGTRGLTLMLSGLPGIQAERVLLVGLGKASDMDARAFAEAVRTSLRGVIATGAHDVLFTLAEVEVAGRSFEERVRTAVVIAREAVYRFDELKTKKEDPVHLGKMIFLVDKSSSKAAQQGLSDGVALANGVDLAKTLGNLPGNICTPTYLADTAKKLGREWKLKVEVLEKKQMQALKMGALLAVAQGSDEPPKLIVVHYQGASEKEAPIVLVGKGITFDTGGISLKPGEAMDEMKFDMCGAASVLGTLRTIAEMRLKINVVGVIPTCENMPSGRAVKPGDIVTSMSGQTIEILNTDAEGRLILCDALTYAGRFKPATIVDIATLTGACVVALGNVNSGLFCPDDKLAQELLEAGRRASDPAWRMPVEEEYQDLLKSNFADMANIGTRAGGAVTAACFLSRYTKGHRWAHLDIAGTAWKSGAAKGGTGRPVPLLTEFVKSRAR